MGDIKLANKRIYPFFVENPISSDNVPRIRMPRNFRPEQIIAVKGDSASGQFDWSLRYDSNSNNTGGGTVLHSDTGVSDNNTGIVYNAPGDFSLVTIPAGDWLWLELANVSTGIFRPVWCMVEVVGVELGA